MFSCFGYCLVYVLGSKLFFFAKKYYVVLNQRVKLIHFAESRFWKLNGKQVVLQMQRSKQRIFLIAQIISNVHTKFGPTLQNNLVIFLDFLQGAKRYLVESPVFFGPSWGYCWIFQQDLQAKSKGIMQSKVATSHVLVPRDAVGISKCIPVPSHLWKWTHE